ncbi:ATP-grasp fold amidoligase family protein [Pantoea sp. 1.19]|uniref:ATP-grasp fold amidoligase family protein n=1 Tax=Pantoea sp. 1.19 TaxID=1925589 RepID=UPI000948E2CC|nr:ATP-grasp fold amidoligase family protein [Pantoea sp. 1.19]
MKYLKRGIKHTLRYLVNKMPWTTVDSIHYFHKFHRLPNIREPKLFNEKVLNRKFINGDHARYARLSDKLCVREYIASKIGEAYLVPLIYETDDPATLLSLPSLRHTVIKPNHGSGMVDILLEEPDAQRKQQLIARCKAWLAVDFSFTYREIHYRFIKPRILVEQYIGEGGRAAVDYKFHMFNKRDGNFEYVLQVIYNRGAPRLSMNFYVNNLRDAFHKIRDTGLDIRQDEAMLTQALLLSRELASEFDYVRVDWYLQGEQLYFGELTFTPGAGLVTGLDGGLNQLMGDMWIQDRKADTAREDDRTLPVVLKKI